MIYYAVSLSGARRCQAEEETGVRGRGNEREERAGRRRALSECMPRYEKEKEKETHGEGQGEESESAKAQKEEGEVTQNERLY